jgi:hypothetical protein
LSNQPQFAKGEERSVIREIVALIIVDFSDVLAVRVATNQRSKPTVGMASDRRAEYVEAPNESADVKSDDNAADRAEKSEGSHLYGEGMPSNEKKMSDGWRGSASLRVEDGISWRVRNQRCQPFAPSHG